MGNEAKVLENIFLEKESETSGNKLWENGIKKKVRIKIKKLKDCNGNEVMEQFKKQFRLHFKEQFKEQFEEHFRKRIMLESRRQFREWTKNMKLKSSANQSRNPFDESISWGSAVNCAIRSVVQSFSLESPDKGSPIDCLCHCISYAVQSRCLDNWSGNIGSSVNQLVQLRTSVE